MVLMKSLKFSKILCKSCVNILFNIFKEMTDSGMRASIIDSSDANSLCLFNSIYMYKYE